MSALTDAGELSKDQVAALLEMHRSRFRSVDNRTMQALQRRGLVEWATPSWSTPRGYWISTHKGNEVRAAIEKATGSQP